LRDFAFLGFEDVYAQGVRDEDVSFVWTDVALCLGADDAFFPKRNWVVELGKSYTWKNAPVFR
jgi:hypothetical protein